MTLLDSKTLVKKFHKFFEEYKKKEIKQIIHEDKEFIELSFFEISEYDIELGDQLLGYPQDVLKLMEITLKEFLEKDLKKNIKVRITSLPATEQLMIRNIRSEHMGKLILLEGLVRRKTDVRPRLTYMEYLCTNPSCSYSETKLRIPQLEDKAKTLKACPKCKSQIEILSKVLVDSQNLVLEEIPEQLENTSDQPKRVNVLLQEDLVSPFKDSKTNPGARVFVTGIVREIPLTTKSGAESINYEIVIDANHIGLSEDDYSEIIISKEEEKQIISLAKKDDIMEILVKNTAPSIYGYNRIKESILLQLFGGSGGTKGDGVKTRGDIHVLLVGDPGAAKSQLLKAAIKVAPKSSFVSGKSASGVGLTATVVKDDLTKGWALEAGAIVLASGGLCAIDELDKMSEEDTSAMHEALEQQCYHYDFELQFADGSSKKIGEYVEGLFEKNKEKIIEGINCEILDIKTKKVLTTDFQKITQIMPKRISRHKAFDDFYKITYSNGRKIIVTSEHPIYIYKNNEVKEISAALVKRDMIVPMPRHTKILGKKQLLIPTKLNIKNKQIKFPKYLDADFAYFLGFYGAEGHNYRNEKNRNYEIGISNTNEHLIDDFVQVLNNILKIKINKTIQLSKNRLKAKKDLFCARIISKPFYDFFKLNFEEFMQKAPQKRIPQKIKTSKLNIKQEFLIGYYLGDGFFDSERCGYSTSSIKMAEDLQDILLNFEIYSYIATEKRKLKKYFKVVITGEENLKKFEKIIKSKEINFKKIEKISEFLNRSKKKLNSRDLIPNDFLVLFNDFLKKCRVSDGTFTTLITRNQNSHKKIVQKYLEKAKNKLKNSKDTYLKMKLKEFENFVNSDIKWIKIKKVEKIKNKDQQWVYDVTIDPTKTFISQGLILHNTISIAKANIRATLKCQTTVLGAANPKFGRFDPYGDIAKQINFPPALMSRFDLIFILRDIPDKKDSLIADHILQTHKDKSKTITELTSDFLKKYIAYTKPLKPVLTQEAIDKIRDFYVRIRNASGDEESGVKSVPITARQLEAIVRLSEAYAKIKLDKKVRVEYATKAIDLIMYCLEKIGIDPKTGELDIDRITTGVTASTRNQYKLIQQIIDKLDVEKPEVNYDDICEEAEKQKISRAETQRILDKLKQEGIIFEPRKNIYKKLL